MEPAAAHNPPATAPDLRAEPSSGPGRRGLTDWVWLGAIILVAFGLRLVYVLQLRASPYFAEHVMDPLYHHQWAAAFARGEVFWEGPYFRAPLYPWFLGVIYRLFGSDNPLAPRLIQAGLGALSCGLLFLIGRSAFGRTTGVIAGLAAASYWILLYFDAELLIPVLIVFLDLVLLGLLLAAGRRRSPVLWALCGLTLGLSAIARPNILLLAPAIVVWIFVLHRRHWRRAVGYTACVLGGCLLPILPITVRNYAVGKDFVLIASQGGVNFYIGNNRHSDGMSAVIKGDPGEWWPCYQAQLARAEKAVGRPLKASEVSRWYFRQALRFMYLEPGPAAWLLLRKLGYFWSGWEVSNNQDIYFMTSHYTPIVRWLPLRFWLVGPLGAMGLLLTFRRARELFPLWGFVLIYTVSVVLFFVTARYRVPVVVVLILLGSHAVCWLVQTVRARRWRSVSWAAVVLAGMGALAAHVPAKVDREMLQEHRETGAFLVSRGRFAEGERLLSELVRRAERVARPVDAESWFYLGFARLKLEDFAGAVQALRQAVRQRPYYLEARVNLGYALAALGRPAEAVAEFEQVVKQDPHDAPAHLGLAGELVRLGRVDEAIGHLLRAVELDRRNTRAALELTRTLRAGGHPREAERLLRAAAEHFPAEPTLTAALVELLALEPGMAARAEAVRIGRQACARLSPPNAGLLHATALACFRCGRLEQAVDFERQAVQAALRDGQTALAEKFRQALERYEAATRGRPQSAPVGRP